MFSVDAIRDAWAKSADPTPAAGLHFERGTSEAAVHVAQALLDGFNALIPADTFISNSYLDYMDTHGMDTSVLRNIWKQMEQNPALAILKIRLEITKDNAIELMQEARQGNCDELHYAARQLLEADGIQAFGLRMKQKSGPGEYNYNSNKQHVFVIFNTDGKDLDYILKNPEDPNNVVIDLWFRAAGDLKSMLSFYKEAFQLDPSIDAVFIGDRDSGYTGEHEFFSNPRFDLFNVTDGLTSCIPYQARGPVINIGNPTLRDECNF
ncbi:MAG: hypothetical protein GC136_06520 [Alphaproteobacteria bacterium]|nr:hypothetical protein [Alphaproteobacteria bacterium]